MNGEIQEMNGGIQERTNKLTQYQKYKKKIIEYNSQPATCECGLKMTRGSLPRHRKTKKHTDKMGKGAAHPNTIEWFLEGYDSESEEEEEEIVLKKGDIDFSKKCNKICFCCGNEITSITKGVAQTKKGFICEDC